MLLYRVYFYDEAISILDHLSLLQELIQNADDAGASEVSFIYCQQKFGTSSLLCSEMQPWQGPALYVYNNGVFKDSDFASLASLAQSGKMDDVSSTGRFGVGFNSVYHFTDLPSIMSGDYIVFLDPHRRFLPASASLSRPGMRFKFVGNRLVEQFPDQFAPLRATSRGSKTLNEYYPGTLFRFPLRTTATAKASEIKSSICDDSIMEELFSSFQGQIADTMLFLRNLKQVSVSIVDGEGVETQRYAIKARDAPIPGHSDFRSMREFLRGADGRSISHKDLLQKMQTMDSDNLPQCAVIRTIQFTHMQTVDTESGGYSFLLCGSMGGARALAMASLPELARLKLLPYAGVAVPLLAGSPAGKLYVCLPLPIETGLPISIDGGFEISSNRRDIWSGSDMTGDGRQRSVKDYD
jgi:sacsin